MLQNVNMHGDCAHPRRQQNNSRLEPLGDKTILVFSRVSFYLWGLVQNPVTDFLTFRNRVCWPCIQLCLEKSHRPFKCCVLDSAKSLGDL